MATTFKTFLNSDITTTKTLLHEAIPITGAIVSGTYDQGDTSHDASIASEYNIKNFAHGMFQSVYDYPYLSSSANHIFDISVGYSTGSACSGSINQFSAQGAIANGNSYGTLSVGGGGLARSQDVNKRFTSTVTVTQGSLSNGSSVVTIVTPRGISITATAHAATTTNAAIDTDTEYAGTFHNNADDATAATNLAACLDAHADISATSSGAVVTIKFLTRATDAHGNRFIGPLTQQEKKIAMYNQMAQVLMGHDKDGNIQRFDRDGQLHDDQNSKMDEVIFINFSRLLVKDEIKKGSFQIKFGTNPDLGTSLKKSAANLLTIKDTNAQNDFRINSPAGEYGILSASHTAKTTVNALATGDGDPVTVSTGKVGLIFYQAGVCVLTASIFEGIESDTTHGRGSTSHFGPVLNTSLSMSIGGLHGNGRGRKGTNQADINEVLTGSKIEHICNNIRRRIYDISFNNTTELNSTVYFCRANHQEFNYSGNPTYLNDSKIRVKQVETDMPISYVTSVGLYSPDNELMAAAKLSEPLRKDPTNELTLRVRLDY